VLIKTKILSLVLKTIYPTQSNDGSEENMGITVNVHVKAALFFTKLKPKIKGAAYLQIHLCLEFSKT